MDARRLRLNIFSISCFDKHSDARLDFSSETKLDNKEISSDNDDTCGFVSLASSWRILNDATRFIEMNVRNKTKTGIKQYRCANASDHPSTYPWCFAWCSGEVSDDGTQSQLSTFQTGKWRWARFLLALFIVSHVRLRELGLSRKWNIYLTISLYTWLRNDGENWLFYFKCILTRIPERVLRERLSSSEHAIEHLTAFFAFDGQYSARSFIQNPVSCTWKVFTDRQRTNEQWSNRCRLVFSNLSVHARQWKERKKQKGVEVEGDVKGQNGRVQFIFSFVVFAVAAAIHQTSLIFDSFLI